MSNSDENLSTQSSSQGTLIQESDLVFPHQDEHVFVVEKPAAMHSVESNSNTEAAPSLEARLKTKFPQLRTLVDAGLVQRLDFETTGVIAGGFSERTQADLKYSLSTGRFSKTYLVLVEGRVERSAEVEGYLFSRYRGSAKVSMQTKPTKRAQFSHSIVIPQNHLNGCTLVQVQSSIARRHQVRVHMASLGHPLVGDKLYGSNKGLSDYGFGFYPSAFILIAQQLSFPHPVTQQTVNCRASWSAESLLERLNSCGSTI